MGDVEGCMPMLGSSYQLKVLTGTELHGRAILCTSPDSVWPPEVPDLNVSGSNFQLRLHPLRINGAGSQLISAVTEKHLGTGRSDGRKCEFFLQGALKESQICGPLELLLRWSCNSVLQYMALPFKPTTISSEELLPQRNCLQPKWKKCCSL